MLKLIPVTIPELLRQLRGIVIPEPRRDKPHRGARADTDVGDENAVGPIAELLAQHRDLDETIHVERVRSDGGDWGTNPVLNEWLAQRGDLEGLRARVDVGDWEAAGTLAGLLAQRGDLEGLRARVDAGDWEAAEPLVGLLIEQGRGEEAERLRRFGLNVDGSIPGG